MFLKSNHIEISENTSVKNQHSISFEVAKKKLERKLSVSSRVLQTNTISIKIFLVNERKKASHETET